MRIIKLVLFTTLIVFVVFSCESPVESLQEENVSINKIQEEVLTEEVKKEWVLTQMASLDGKVSMGFNEYSFVSIDFTGKKTKEKEQKLPRLNKDYGEFERKKVVYTLEDSSGVLLNPHYSRKSIFEHLSF